MLPVFFFQLFFFHKFSSSYLPLFSHQLHKFYLLHSYSYTPHTPATCSCSEYSPVMSSQNPSSYPSGAGQVTLHLLHLEQISTAGTILKLDAQEHELQVGSDSVKGELLCRTCLAITPASLPHSLISLHHSHSLCDLAHRRWETLSATAACYQSPRQGELRMSWVHACKTDGHAAILQIYPAFFHSHPWAFKFLCSPQLVEL